MQAEYAALVTGLRVLEAPETVVLLERAEIRAAARPTAGAPDLTARLTAAALVKGAAE